MGPHRGQEGLKCRVRRLQRRLREQEHEIRAITTRNQASAVNAATLDLRVAVRETRAEIARLVIMAGKGTLDSHDSDSSTGGSGRRRGTPTPRLPVDPLPQRPPLPRGKPPRAAQETDRDRDPLFTMSVKEETQVAGGSPWAPKGEPHKLTPCMTGPTELPGFNPRVPPPRLTQLIPI